MWKILFPHKSATIQGMALEPYYIKLFLPDGQIWLLNRHMKQVSLINPAEKTAKIMDITNEPPDIYDTARYYTDSADCQIEKMGQLCVDRKQTIGFHLTNKQDNDVIIVWVDPHSQLPMSIEFLEVNKSGQMEPKIVWSDIVFDVESDETPFIFDLEGYKVEKLDSVWDWENFYSTAVLEHTASL